MRTYDFSPLLRSAVGFDRMAQMMDGLARGEETGYPPYNIEKLGEDAYRITMAVAGFSEDELEVTTKDTTLVVSGKAKENEGEATFLHRGIARRAFERRFALAEHIKVTGARLENGLLHVELVREVPEAKKPRTIEIERGAPAQSKVIESQAA
ncbi:Hsp20 family protein [Rhodovibrio salinarum]|uniref:Heat-shock protein n=1 Tax=Rhodovibrio salinarum TaxID=1087 RepID=A0A934QKZ0_9PROT|nr:Hsp20 family protein [Rhodovibrio salinarum]MBK1698841.1 heat-shock protein [Rhodovibrio salinarum]